MRTPSEILEAAADLLERKGWIRGRLADYDGYCSIGALTHTAEDRLGMSENTYTPELKQAFLHLVKVLGTRRDFRGCRDVRARMDFRLLVDRCSPVDAVMVWNDRLAEGRQEVLDTFREAAKEARKEEEGL